MMDFIKNGSVNINVTTGAILKIVFVFLLLYFIFLIQDVIALLFVALILSSAIDPWVDWMHGKKIPRALGIILIYLLIFGVVGGVVYLIIPPIAQEFKDLAQNFPRYMDRILSGFEVLRSYSEQHGLLDNIKNSLGSVGDQLQRTAGNIFTTVSGIFGGILSFFLVLVLTFYMVVEENAIKKLVWSIAPEKHQVYIMHLVNRMQQKIGLWLRGQLILSFSIFVLTYIGLLILGVKYALVLALIAGLLEFIPYLGPTLSAIPAVFLAFTQAPALALFTLGLYYIVQLVENNILVPKIMQKTVGLNPIISISALLVGYKLAGVVGAILSIPVATAVSVFVKDVFDHKEAMKSSSESGTE